MEHVRVHVEWKVNRWNWIVIDFHENHKICIQYVQIPTNLLRFEPICLLFFIHWLILFLFSTYLGCMFSCALGGYSYFSLWLLFRIVRIFNHFLSCVFIRNGGKEVEERECVEIPMTINKNDDGDGGAVTTTTSTTTSATSHFLCIGYICYGVYRMRHDDVLYMIVMYT